MKKIAIIKAESKPSRMSPEQLQKVFDKLKKGQEVEVWAESVMSGGAPQWVTYDVGRKSKSKKFNLEKITLTRGESRFKSFLYNRLAKEGISFALGDMGTSLVALRVKK